MEPINKVVSKYKYRNTDPPILIALPIEFKNYSNYAKFELIKPHPFSEPSRISKWNVSFDSQRTVFKSVQKRIQNLCAERANTMQL